MRRFGGDRAGIQARRVDRREEAGRGGERVGVGRDQGLGEGWRVAADDCEAVGDQPANCGQGVGVGWAAAVSRAPAGSQLDRLMGVIGQVLEQWPEIKAPRLTELLGEEHGYGGSVDLVRRRLAGLRPRVERPAQRTGYRPGHVVQFEWAEMPTRPRIEGIERRVYALIASLPFSGAETAHFSFDMTLESFLEGHVRVFDWLGGVPRECVYDNLRSVVAKRDSREVVRGNPRFSTSSQSSRKYSRIMSGSTPTVSSSRGGSQGAGSDAPHPRRRDPRGPPRRAAWSRLVAQRPWGLSLGARFARRQRCNLHHVHIGRLGNQLLQRLTTRLLGYRFQMFQATDQLGQFEVLKLRCRRGWYVQRGPRVYLRGMQVHLLDAEFQYGRCGQRMRRTVNQFDLMIARIELQQVFWQTREAAENTTGPGEEASLYRSDLPQKAQNIRLQFALLQKQAGSLEHLDTQHSGIDL